VVNKSNIQSKTPSKVTQIYDSIFTELFVIVPAMLFIDHKSPNFPRTGGFPEHKNEYILQNLL
jgi:hypothetical protein